MGKQRRLHKRKVLERMSRSLGRVAHQRGSLNHKDVLNLSSQMDQVIEEAMRPLIKSR